MNYYNRYVSRIVSLGEARAPRGLEIKSLQAERFAVKTGITYRRPMDNPLIGFMEGLQFIAEIFNKDAIARIAPHARLDLFGFNSAYGPRVMGQTEKIIDELINDPATRRAVMILAKPDENLALRPCTTSLQFRVNGYRLDTIVNMRSSDAVYGLPYDLTQFGMLSMVIASCAGFVTNNLIIEIGDAHVYLETKHLASGSKQWEFELPDIEIPNGLTSLDSWKAWAMEAIGLLSPGYVNDTFKYKKSEVES